MLPQLTDVAALLEIDEQPMTRAARNIEFGGDVRERRAFHLRREIFKNGERALGNAGHVCLRRSSGRHVCTL